MHNFRNWLAAAGLALACAGASAHDIADFVKPDSFIDIKISPDGTHYAATLPLGDRTVLAVLRREDMSLTGSLNLGKRRHVADFWWASNDRVLAAAAEKIGQRDEPYLTGDLWGINADGKRAELLVGQSLVVSQTGSRIQAKREEQVFAMLVDPLRDSEDEVIISVSPFTDDPFTRAERMDIHSGRRALVARAPVRNGRFATDAQGRVRAVQGLDLDNTSLLYLRPAEGGDWTLVNDEGETGRVDSPLGFSTDGNTLYLRSDRRTGPDVIVAYDVATGARRDLLEDDDTSPYDTLFSLEDDTLVGATFMDGRPRTDFIDTGRRDVRLYRSLQAAFPGEYVEFTSQTSDGRMLLVQVSSDRNPGDYYLFDTTTMNARLLVSRREWLDPEALAPMEPVSLAARDGLPLKGYLTRPPGATGAGPLVVMPHGGPYGIFDRWGFDEDVQILASAGFSVLQVNFRGSGNHGRAFKQAGARQWGQAMQDDVTDATRWAIQQGIADPARICIHGASYGAYAALMGVAREPSLYRCASGYVGVYDLPEMQAETRRESRRLAGWSEDWVGNDQAVLAANSPNRIAASIRVPVFLAAGGEDEIAPIGHSHRMERALRTAGVPVETLYYPTEGHGFYVEANRREYYTRLVDFLGRHLGAPVATTAGPTVTETSTP
jgi:dipeptidyl aminopeptidase/acylaminoacyl peptidase